MISGDEDNGGGEMVLLVFEESSELCSVMALALSAEHGDTFAEGEEEPVEDAKEALDRFGLGPRLVP